MKILFGEFPANYEKYYFPYQVWLVKEERDNISKIYEMGFLPVRSIKNLYYLCRSVKVDLKRFKLSSENRRILRKTKEFEWELVKLGEFKYTPSVQKSCKDWFSQRFGRGRISAAAIRKIFTSGIFTHVFAWSLKNETIGCAVVYMNQDLLHYAHVFYDPDLTKTNLGARMMLEVVIWAKENGKKYAYLGTCYTKSALYKTQYAGVEFFNGFFWADNLDELKYLVERSNGGFLFQDKDYLKRFQKGRNLKELIEEIKGI